MCFHNLRSLGIRSVFSALLLLTLVGCVSVSRDVTSARSGLQSGNDTVALAWAEKKKSSLYSKSLGYLETGRIRMLGGDFLGSSTNFSIAINSVIDETAEGPVLKIGDVGADIMAGTLTDDRTRSYDLPAYEFIQALNYQMLNHLFLGDFSAACVEARRAVFAQNAIADKYADEVAKAQEAEPQQPETNRTENDTGEVSAKDKETAMRCVEQKMASMAPVLEKSRCSYENALVWYLAGALLEEQKDISNAALCYRKANEISPHNPYIRRDFLRMLATQDQIAYQTLIKQHNLKPQDVARAPSELIIILEESFVPQRKSIKIPLPVGGTLTSVEIPFYEEDAHNPMSFEISCDGTNLGGGAQAVNIQSLAYHDLKEKMPGIVLRNVTRVGTRIAAQQVANHAGGDAAKLAVLAFNTVSTVINKADTRAWHTLPAIAYLSCHAVEPGRRNVTLHNPATGYTICLPVEIAQGERRLIWIADIEGCSRVGTASLSGKGTQPTFVTDGSLLTGPRILNAAK
jgi:uncharacterized protein